MIDSDETRAKRHLEWARLEAAVLSRCQSGDTRRRGLPIEQTYAATSAALSESAEVMALLHNDEVLPLHDLRELDPHLLRVSRGGTLEGTALADIRITLRCARAVRRFLQARSAQVPNLISVAILDPSLDGLEDALGTAIEVDGTLFDHASSNLRKLRAEVSNLRARIIARLEHLIDKHQDILSDRYYTLREDRYVVPVRTDAHERLQGIVHATSDSGSSVFVEPSAIVNQGNRLKMAQGDLYREEQRILGELSALVGERHATVVAAVESLCRLDLRQATGKLAAELKAEVPQLSTDGHMTLKAARHPLLLLDGVDVVPNHLDLKAGEGLVISGPNAGGKTVLLKTVGLFALMVRAGIPIPVDPDSTMAYFHPVLSDLGDEQSTQHNLSTFSAHVRALSHILEHANSSSLVLLDELCSGTDPQEGAALACAISERLVEQQATLMLTTHYEPLKAFAIRQPGLRSASVGFDLETMQPSFVLQLDVPGASSALSVAQRFGIPLTVIERAREVLPQQSKDFEALITQLNQRAQVLRQEETLAREARREMERLRNEHDERLHRLKERSQKKLTVEAEQVMAELREARSTLRNARNEARKHQLDKEALRAAEKNIQQVSSRLAVGGDLARASTRPDDVKSGQPAVNPTELTAGAKVYVPHLRSEGVVLETEKSRVRVAVGSLKLWVDASGLQAGKHGSDERRTASRGAPDAPVPLGRTPDNTLSVRGMRVDDALPMMESFIDRMRMSHHRMGYVEHGHGSGALRRAVRTHLKDSVAHVREVRAGDEQEGGDAVTAFVLTD